MVVPWQGAVVFVGLTGLPHPDFLLHCATWLTSSLQTSLVESQYSFFSCRNEPGGLCMLMQFLFFLLCILIAWVVCTAYALCEYRRKVHDKKPPIGDGNTTMQSGNFHNGLFDCFSNKNECMCSFFCPALRFADTFSSVNSVSFWTTFSLFFVLNVVPEYIFDYGVNMVLPFPNQGSMSDGLPLLPVPDTGLGIFDYGLSIFWNTRYGDPTSPAFRNAQICELLDAIFRGLVFGLWARGKIRTKLGDPTPSKNQLYDVVSWCLCPCCALTQEAVEADIAADVTVSCCFTLTKGRVAVRAREASTSDYEKMVGDAVLLEGR